MVKIVITGAGGYIGSKLVDFFSSSRQTELYCFDNFRFHQKHIVLHHFKGPRNCKKLEFYDQDITKWDRNLIEAIKSADVIFPLAALVGAPLCDKEPEEAKKINSEWFKDLINVLPSDKEQSIIYPNTNSGYGASGKQICTEFSPLNPLSLYAETKLDAEKTLLEAVPEKTTVFRLATVFGKSIRTRIDLLVNNLIGEGLAGDIELFDPDFRRNYIHVDDIVSAFYFAIGRKDMRGEVYNLGNDSLNMTKKELVEKICQRLGVGLSILKERTDPDKRDYIVSSAKLNKLGFKCRRTLEYGIEEMIPFYKELEEMDYWGPMGRTKEQCLRECNPCRNY